MLNAVKHLYPARKAPRRELRFFAEFILSEAEGLRMTFREVLIFNYSLLDYIYFSKEISSIWNKS
jgi:hypothetical protein